MDDSGTVYITGRGSEIVDAMGGRNCGEVAAQVCDRYVVHVVRASYLMRWPDEYELVECTYLIVRSVLWKHKHRRESGAWTTVGRTRLKGD